MAFPDLGHSFGSRDKTYQSDIAGTLFLDKVDGGAGGSSRGEHGIDEKNITLSQISRKLAIIFHGLQSLRIPIETDMTHLGIGHQPQDTIHHTQPRPEHRHDGELLSRNGFHLCFFKRSLHFRFPQRKIAGNFINHEPRNFLYEFPKFLHRGIHVSDNTYLVLHERMIDHMASRSVFWGHAIKTGGFPPLR